MSYAARPVAVNGLTTATNAATTNASAAIAITGSTIMIAVGVAAKFGCYIMFGGPNLSSTLTSSTGFALPAGFVGRLSVPPNSTHLYHLRAEASNGDISVWGSDGGI